MCRIIIVLVYLVFHPVYTASALKGSKTLTRLTLWQCVINGTALSHLHEGLSTNPTLRFLDLSGNSLGTEGARHLGKDGLYSQACVP